MSEPAGLDRALWFEPGCCAGGGHFLHNNPHTFQGRMEAYCEAHDRTFAVCRSEIERCSHEAEYWIRGFLFGTEPPPPLDPDGYEIDDLDDWRWRRWRDAIEVFRRVGAWPAGAPTGPTNPDRTRGPIQQDRPRV